MVEFWILKKYYVCNTYLVLNYKKIMRKFVENNRWKKIRKKIYQLHTTHVYSNAALLRDYIKKNPHVTKTNLHIEIEHLRKLHNNKVGQSGANFENLHINRFSGPLYFLYR